MHAPPHPGPDPARRIPSALDELALAPPQAAALYRELDVFYRKQDRAMLDQIIRHGARLMRELGVTYQPYGREPDHEHVVPFDPFPRVMAAAEWQKIRRGIEQRIAVWEAFFRDIYHEQECLRAGIIPYSLVFDDPNYLHAAVHVRIPQDTYVHLAAFDLARDDAGNWLVTEDHVANTTGASYAWQSRSVLSQACPGLLELAGPAPIRSYPTDLLEHLKRFSPAPNSQPNIVLLSAGVASQAYYEHSFLARQMGIPVVQGSDLTVLNGRVYFKTITGLEPVDVIYRRMDDSYIDPLAFRHDSQLGVPGLMTCVRKGSVTIANAIGTTLGHSRSIAACLPRLARFFRNETLVLPTVERYNCYDPDQLDLVLSRLSELKIQPVADRSFQNTFFGPDLTEPDLLSLRQQLLANPSSFIAEPALPASRLPCFTPEGLSPRHAELRVFCLGGSQPRMHPIALTRFAPRSGSRSISSGLEGGIKDTWLLDSAAEPKSSPARLGLNATKPRLRLGSRIADSLFWMGRYLERSESITRVLAVLHLMHGEVSPRPHSSSLPVTWQALAKIMGQPHTWAKRFLKSSPSDLARQILLDRQNPSAVIRLLDLVRTNAHSIREAIPPELWVTLNRLHFTLDNATYADRWSGPHSSSQSQMLEETVLNQMDALSGSAANNMLRDDGWHFWRMGLALERAIITLQILQACFHRQSPLPGSQTQDRVDALLRMLACQYAYRSLFQTHPTAASAASLLLQDTQLPRSVLYCLYQIHHSLQVVFGQRRERLASQRPEPVQRIDQLLVTVQTLSVHDVINSRSGPSRAGKPLSELADQFTALSTAISDHYLYHQAFNILP